MDKGWCGAPKSILQVLYERGYINTDYVKTPRSARYSLNGGGNDFDTNGEILEESKNFIFTTILNKCKDFLEEKSDIEQLYCDVSEQMAFECSILFTPKFH